MNPTLRARPLRIGLSTLALLALAALTLSRAGVHRALHRASPPADASAVRTLDALRPLWPAGMELVYAFRWSAETETDVSALRAGRDVAAGSLALAGELSVTPLGREGDETILELRVRSLTEHRVRVLDVDALATPEAAAATFDGHAAYARLGPDGAVRRVDYRKGTPALFQHLATGLAGAFGLSVRSTESSWRAVEPTSLGRALVSYARTDDGAALSLARTRTGYEELTGLPAPCDDCTTQVSGGGRVELDPRGMPSVLRDDEAVRVSRADGRLALGHAGHFEATLLRVGPPAATLASIPAADATDARVPGRAPTAVAANERVLDQRIAGLTSKELFADLDQFAMAGHEVIPEGWLGRATALLEKNPKLCGEVVARIQDPALRSEGRVLFVELLAATGTTDAQAAMRRALDLPVARDDARAYRLMIQRFALVQHPDAASLTFLADLHARARSDGDEQRRVAALYAIGGAVHAAGAASPAGREAAELLRAETRAAHTLDTRRNTMFALGNAGLPDTAELTSAARRDSDPAVRAAAARALRRVPARDAREALVALAQDGEAEVQLAALTALGAMPVAGADATRLARAVEQGLLSAENDALVVRLLGSAPPGTEVEGALRAVLARCSGQPQLEAQVRMLLARGKQG